MKEDLPNGVKEERSVLQANWISRILRGIIEKRRESSNKLGRRKISVAGRSQRKNKKSIIKS